MSGDLVSVVVATYRRHEVLIETLSRLLALDAPADELVVVDQTKAHPPEVEGRLRSWHESGKLRWLRRPEPSIPGAMNAGLAAARGEVILFVDDDVEPSAALVSAHRAAHRRGADLIVAGQVIQPGESPEPLAGERFSFRSSVAQPVTEFIGCNFSVRRAFAVSLGGFDENFVRAAYRFEADFAARASRAGGRIEFEPAASLRHLHVAQGGTRSFGEHLRTAGPAHSVGEYYHLLRNRPSGGLRRLLTRPWRAAMTRHHLRRPWWIPATLFGELSGLTWALALAAAGPKLMANEPERRGDPA